MIKTKKGLSMVLRAKTKNRFDKRPNKALVIYALMTFLLVITSLYFTFAVPQGASILDPSVDSGPTVSPDSRQDDGGQIITIDVQAEQQNDAWKAYVGNVSGKYVLKNADSESIYEWPLGATIDGEVYISRNDSVNFSSGAISCASSAEMAAENTFFGFGAGATDDINSTFNSTSHAAFDVGGGNHMTNCPSTALWVNNLEQDQTAAADFQEIVIHDGTNIVYAALINNDNQGFDGSSTFDFQTIVPENRTASTGTRYYFYLELGS